MKTASLYWITGAVSLGGLLFGFDTGVISGCEEAIQDEFALSPFWHGLVVAGALVGTVFGAVAAGRMCDWLGRKQTLVWMGVLFLVSAAGCAATPGGRTLGPYVLGFMRFVGGLAIGGVSVAVPMYIAEIAPPEKRGRLVLVNQFCIVLGIVVSYVSNYSVARWLPASPSAVWRTMLGVECLPALMYLLALVRVPESPMWLAVRRLGDRPHGGGWGTCNESAPLFARCNLKPLLLCFTVAFFSQLSGVNAVNYYAPRIFRMIFGEGSELVSLAGTIGVGIVNLVFTVLAFFFIDRVGRRPMLIVGCAAMAAMHGLVAWQISLGTACTPWLALSGVYGFIAAVAFSASAVIWVFISEIFPPDVRAKGQGFGGTVHWIMCMLVSWLFPVAVAHTGMYAFAFFAAMMLLEMAWAIFLMPETKCKSITEK